MVQMVMNDKTLTGQKTLLSRYTLLENQFTQFAMDQIADEDEKQAKSNQKLRVYNLK